MLTIREWVEEMGGADKAAAALGVCKHSIWKWHRREARPHIETVQKMIRLSKGRLTIESIIKCTRAK